MSYRPPKKPTLALETDIVQDNIPAEVYPNIYIGSIHAAFNQEILLNLGITHILNASRLPSTFPKSFTYLSIDIRDKDEANILACIPAANIFIEAGIESGGVMVHCYGGRSRSAALVAAFLMSSFDWSYSKSLQTIQAARPVAHINRGFEIQLKAYVHAKYDVYLAQQVLLQGRVRALQCYRSIEGNTADELLIKENERKKFGSLHTVGSNGYASSRRKNSPYNPHNNRPGSKRSWGNAKDEDETETEDNNDSSSSEDAEEEDNLMESAVKSYHTNHPLDRTKESYNSQKLNKTPFSAISSSSSSLLLTNNTPSHNHHIINSSSNNYLTSPRTPLNNNHNNNCNSNNNGNGSTTIHLLASNDNSNNISNININNNNNNNNNNTSYQYVDHSQTTNSTKLRQHIPLMDPRSPRLRLSRPGSTSVRVIPPLRGLERVFCCSWCHCQLFNLASVIRTDVKVDPLPDYSSNWADEKDDSHTTHKLHSSSSSSSHSITSFSNHVNIIQASPRGSSKMTAPSSQEKESTYLMPAPSPRGSNISFSNVTYPDDAKLSSSTYLSPDKFGINKNNSHTNVINNCYSYGFDDIGLNVSNSSLGGVANTSRRNSEYKSPPKTSRSKGAKTFDFDIFSDDSNNFKSNHNGDNRNNNNNNNHDNDEETSTLKSVSEIPIFQNNNNNYNINNNNNNNINTNINTINNELNENRVSSPMEISDEKQLSSHNETNINIYTKEVDEKQYLNESTTLSLSSPSSLSSSRRSSKNHFRLQVSSEGLFNKDESHQHHHQQQQQQHSNIINSSRPSSSNSVNSNNSRQRENILSLPTSLSRNSSIQQIQQQQQPPLSPTESPRIVFPHEPRESYAYPSPRNRPQSAEKRRWLERVNLLKSDSSSAKFEHNDHLLSNNTNNNNNTNFNSNSYDNTRIKKHDEKVTKLSQDDDEAIKLGFGRDKYIYLEYLEWMGEELLSSSINSGDLKCNHCSHIIGSWSWTPNYRQTLNGILQVPIIKVHKNVIHEVDVPLDQTPLNTPRIDDQMEDGNANV